MTPHARAPERRIARRRALVAVAATAAFPLAALAGSRERAPPVLRWRGIALGAPAAITLYHADPARARRALAACLAELARLEAIFSLYRADSELVALNRAGRLAAPSHDLVLLLEEAVRFGALSGGAFDVTAQPLWRLYARHFAKPGADPDGPPADAVARARALVDYRAIDLGPGRVRLARPGMAVTLNGIAQGAITDRIAEILGEAGFASVLVDLGELRALGRRAGRPWRIGIEDPQQPGRIAATVPLADAALARSGGYGTRFEASGRFHHIFDPHTGRSAHAALATSAVAARATVADALATALAVAGPGAAGRLVRAFGAAEAALVLGDGSRVRVRNTA